MTSKAKITMGQITIDANVTEIQGVVRANATLARRTKFCDIIG
jgi:hypothetical protein